MAGRSTPRDRDKDRPARDNTRERELGIRHYSVRLTASEVSRAARAFDTAAADEKLDSLITMVTGFLVDGELMHWTCIWGTGTVSADFAVHGADRSIRMQMTQEGRDARKRRLTKLYGKKYLVETWILNPTRALDGVKWKYGYHVKVQPKKKGQRAEL